MWCRHCQQDVPAVAKATSGGVQCARCHGLLGKPAFAATANNQFRSDIEYGAANSETEEVVFEPWKLADVLGPHDGQQFNQIGRHLRSTRQQAAASKPAERLFRIDSPQSSTQTALAAPASLPRMDQPRSSYRPPAPREASRPNQLIAWIAALLGALALGAGVGLLGWSLVGHRPDLWNWGLAATLGGQGLMIVGLVQILANLWTGNRDATNRLITLQYEMRRLQRTADSLAGMRSATPSAFYADLARGSSPQVLLASLKGQVEELTSRLSTR